jgi:hypothetical protein
LDRDRIVEELKSERARLDRAIAALQGPASSKIVKKTRKAAMATQQPVAPGAKKRGGLTAEGRKRLSLAMKKRWADRKKKGS